MEKLQEKRTTVRRQHCQLMKCSFTDGGKVSAPGGASFHLHSCEVNLNCTALDSWSPSLWHHTAPPPISIEVGEGIRGYIFEIFLKNSSAHSAAKKPGFRMGLPCGLNEPLKDGVFRLCKKN